jgi:hypothetical protein
MAVLNLEKMIARLAASFDAIPMEHRDPDLMHAAAVKLNPEDRARLYHQMMVVVVVASRIKAAISDGESELIGVAADTVQVMNLLCALDTDRLSLDVVDHFCDELGRLFGGWTALPADLSRMMTERMEGREEAAHEHEEAEAEAELAQANDQTKH